MGSSPIESSTFCW